MNSSAFPPLPRVPFLLIFAPPHPTDPRIALTIGDRNLGGDRPRSSGELSKDVINRTQPIHSIPIFIGGAPADLEAVDVGGGGGGGQKKSLCESRITIGGGMADSATAILSLV